MYSVVGLFDFRWKKNILCSRYRYIELSNRKEKENNFLFLFYDENLKIPLEKLFTTFCMNGEWIALEKFLTLIVFCKGHQRGSLFHSRQMNLNGIMTGFFSLPWCICVFLYVWGVVLDALSHRFYNLHIFSLQQKWQHKCILFSQLKLQHRTHNQWYGWCVFFSSHLVSCVFVWKKIRGCVYVNKLDKK